MQESTEEPGPTGRRERNRRALRRALSDTATAMFLDRGFDAVRVSDVAQACGVSTKTVWNHFPTKESLLLDRGERLADALRAVARQRPGDVDVLDVVVDCIETEIQQLADGGHHPDPPRYTEGPESRAEGITWSVQAFVRLVEAHPGLRAAAADRYEQLVRLAADALAAQGGTPAEAPHNQILAGALVSLWRLHLSALLNASEKALPVADLQDHVRHEVQVGADLVARFIATASVSSDDGSRPWE